MDDMKGTCGVPADNAAPAKVLSPYLNRLHCAESAHSFNASRAVYLFTVQSCYEQENEAVFP